MEERKKTCFFISPFGKEGSERRRVSTLLQWFFLEPVLTKFGFETGEESSGIRADQKPSSAITEQMLQDLQNADLCIADLTGLNPNVLWEVGYRSRIGKPLIVMAQSGTEIPFDMYDNRIIWFPDPIKILDEIEKWNEPRNALKKRINAELEVIERYRREDEQRNRGIFQTQTEKNIQDYIMWVTSIKEELLDTERLLNSKK